MDTIQHQHLSSFYIRHKGLIINLFSVLSFLGINAFLGDKGINNLSKVPLMALIYVFVFFLEPWATAYSMGAFNQRRERAGLKPIALHQWMGLGFLGIAFWGGRTSINSLLFLASLDVLITWEELKNSSYAPFFFIGMMIREGFIVYYMSSKKPKPDFKESYDFMADLVLFLAITYGQMIVAEVFRDLRVKNLLTIEEIGLYLFPILLFSFVFYLPIRYIYTVEDFTFARTKWQKAEQVLSFIIVLLGFVVAR